MLPWQIAAFVAANSLGRFVLYTRAFDDAGNVGEVIAVEWWVDPVPPLPPVLLAAPDAISLSTSALFQLKMVGSRSPGRISFHYNVTCTGSGATAAIVADLPTLAQPSPTNNDPVELSLTGLQPDRTYTMMLSSFSQAGVASLDSTVFSWQILSSAPSVVVAVHPDTVSGSDRPVFQFVARGPTAEVAPAFANVTYLVALLGDIGAYRGKCAACCVLRSCAMTVLVSSHCRFQTSGPFMRRHCVILPSPVSWTVCSRAAVPVRATTRCC